MTNILLLFVTTSKVCIFSPMKNVLDQQINHRIAILAGLLKRQIYRIIAEEQLDITPEQWVVLSYLWEENGLSIGTIAQRSRKDFGNVTRIIDKLSKQQYVTKKRSKEDARSTLIYYTDKAMGIKSKVEQCQQRSLNISLAGVSAEEQELLLRLINRMEKNSLRFLEGLD